MDVPDFGRLRRVFWLYAIVKIFFFDIDAFVLQTAFPAHAWLLNLWFLFIVIALAVALICSDTGSVFFWCDYIILFPLVVLLWKIPRMMAATGEPSGVIH